MTAKQEETLTGGIVGPDEKASENIREGARQFDRAVRARKRAGEKVKGSTAYALWAKEAASYFPPLVKVSTLQGAALLGFVKALKNAFNAPALDEVSEDGAASTRTALSQVASVVLHPATAELFVPAWASGRYGEKMPDGKMTFTVGQGLKLIRASVPSKTPQDRIRELAVRLLKDAVDKGLTITAMVAVIESLRPAPAQPASVPAVG